MKQINKSYCCVGLMSGTSLDGLDILLCELFRKEHSWGYYLKKAVTIPYSKEMVDRLRSASQLSGYKLIELHRQYGDWLGKQVNDFLTDEREQPDLIASHGHTIFHQPHQKVSLQIGDGAMIASRTGILTVSDFRTLDIALGGQGAPLVPIGDRLLFTGYKACVNLGGFANMSCETSGQRMAWDICPVNFVVNQLAQQIGQSFDRDGQLGRSGQVIPPLLNQLNAVPFYAKSGPKSLGEEWVNQTIHPLLEAHGEHLIKDLIRTFYEHIAIQVAHHLEQAGKGDYLFTGGGVYNRFLMERIAHLIKGNIVIPDKLLIEYKEALVFALLGVLRLEKEVNCLSSVTGARRDSSSGVVHLPGM